MNTADVKVGTEVALGTRRTVQSGWARRAIVLQTGLERRVLSPSKSRHHVTFDGVEIQYIDDEGKRAHTFVVRSADVAMTWTEYLALRTDVATKRAERKLEYEAKQLEAIMRIRQCLPTRTTVKGLSEQLRDGFNRPSLETIAEIVESAYRTGARR